MNVSNILNPTFTILSVSLSSLLLGCFWLSVHRLFIYRKVKYFFFLLFALVTFILLLILEFLRVNRTLSIIYLIPLLLLLFVGVLIKSIDYLKKSKHFSVDVRIIVLVFLLTTIIQGVHPAVYTLWKEATHKEHEFNISKDINLLTFFLNKDKKTIAVVADTILSDQSFLNLVESGEESRLSQYVREKTQDESLDIFQIHLTESQQVIGDYSNLANTASVLGTSNNRKEVSIAPWNDNSLAILVRGEILDTEGVEKGEIIIGKKLDSEYFQNIRSYLSSDLQVVDNFGVPLTRDQTNLNEVDTTTLHQYANSCLPQRKPTLKVCIYSMERNSSGSVLFVLLSRTIDYSQVSKYVTMAQIILFSNFVVAFFIESYLRKKNRHI